MKATNQPGPGVIILHVAVTHIEQNTEGFTLSDVLPIKMVFNLARRASGLEKYIAKISVISQLEDSQTGELIAGRIGLREQDKSGSSAASIDRFREWLDHWGPDIAKRLAEVLPSVQQLETP